MGCRMREFRKWEDGVGCDMKGGVLGGGRVLEGALHTRLVVFTTLEPCWDYDV